MISIRIEAVHVHLHGFPDERLDIILQEVLKMSKELDDLKAEVASDTSVMEAAVTLIAGLEQQIRDNATDPAALTSLADQLASARSDLASAVTANTPSDPAAPAAVDSGSAGGAPAADAGSTSSGGGDVTTTTNDSTAGDGTASGDSTSASAPAGDTGDSGQSALDPTVSPAAGEQATSDQSNATDTGGATVTP